jgi:acyl-CoA thioesterase
MPSLKTFRISALYLGHGEAGMEMEVGSAYTNHQGTAHGGLVGALLDTAIGIAAWTLNSNVLTLEMNVNYIAPLKIGEIVKAEGWVIHAGRINIVAEGEIRNQQNKLIAKSRITYYRIGSFI